MFPRENPLFGCTRSKPSQCSDPAGLTLASDFGFCFQCQAGSSLVLRRPIETTGFIRSQLTDVCAAEPGLMRIQISRDTAESFSSAKILPDASVSCAPNKLKEVATEGDQAYIDSSSTRD